MTNFDTALDCEGTLAIGTQVAFIDLADVGNLAVTAIAIPVRIPEVFAFLVSPTDKIPALRCTVIGDHSQR